MVFFFTGTGNSLYAARRIAQATHDQTKNIAQLMREGTQTFEADADRGSCVPSTVTTFRPWSSVSCAP